MLFLWAFLRNPLDFPGVFFASANKELQNMALVVLGHLRPIHLCVQQPGSSTEIIFSLSFGLKHEKENVGKPAVTTPPWLMIFHWSMEAILHGKKQWDICNAETLQEGPEVTKDALC